MAQNDRDRLRRMRLMQEAVDERLSTRQTQELRRRLEAEPEAKDEFDRLRGVDERLREAPFERAPQQLAMKIMSRLAEAVPLQQMSHAAGLALALALALVTAVLLPLLAGLAWLMLSAIGSSTALTSALNQIALILSGVINAMDGIAQGARSLLEVYPELPAVLTLIPVSLFGVWRARIMRRGKSAQTEIG